MPAFLRPSAAILAACALALAACSDASEPLKPPDAPAGLTATPFNGAVALSWSPAPRAVTYNVYRSATAGQQPAAMTAVATGLGDTAFNAPATNDTLLYYRVTAVNSAGESAGSAEVSATALGTLPPAAPTGVAAAPANQQVTLSWDDVPAATSYKVYWRTSPGVSTGDASFACAASPCVHSSLTNGLHYYYAVVALVSATESALSAEVMAIPAVLPYIDASALWMPGVGNEYEVQVCTDSTCSTPISSAQVSISGTALAYDGVDTFSAAPGGSLAGAPLNLVVVIPSGAGVASGTYTASGTMYTTAPTLTNPTNGSVWQASQANEMTWTAGAPTDGAMYAYALINTSNFTFNLGIVPGATMTSATLAAGALTAGNHMAFVGISPMTAIPIPNTQPGSGFLISASSPYVTFTVQ